MSIYAASAYQTIKAAGEQKARDSSLSVRVGMVKHYGPDHSVDSLSQEEIDVGFWYGTLKDQTPESQVLNRLFSILWYGGLYWRKAARLEGACPVHGCNNHADHWHPWDGCASINNVNLPLATALSRGGAVVIQLPLLGEIEEALTGRRGRVGGGDADKIWRWIWGNKPITSRMAATHGLHMSVPAHPIGHNGENAPWAFKEWVEDKKNNGHHFGFNMSGGGKGNRNYLTGSLISANGEHGYVYFCYHAPTATKTGAILLKVEDSAPVDAANRTNNISNTARALAGGVVDIPAAAATVIGTGFAKAGKVMSKGIFGSTQMTGTVPGFSIADKFGLYSLWPRAQNGAYHAVGHSASTSITGNAKFKDMDACIPTDYDCMFVNPSIEVWMGLISDPSGAFDPSWLGYSGPNELAMHRPGSR